MASSKKRYAIVGTGGRSSMYIDSLARDYRHNADLVGFCDLSRTRMQFYNDRIKKRYDHPPVPMYPAGDFDRMIRESKCDVVIVTSMDSTHHEYIIRAMELGCDVISEKPMTTDAEKARAIFDAIKRTGRNLRVTFNMRYVPFPTKVRELIRDGTIGTVTSVHFEWVLDTSHGADYFRRWHREKDKSGGLIIHKSTHHFDTINWWIDSYPKTVYSMGDLRFYGRENAVARGEKNRTTYTRYTGEPAAKDDPFKLTLENDENLVGLYKNAEADSGYIRDRNVFGDNITAEDTIAVMCRYRNNVILNYSLVCYSPWEGYRASITGTKGRLEVFQQHGSHIIAGQSEEELAEQQARNNTHRITVYPMFGKPYDVEVETIKGAHGGGDRLLLEQLFSDNPPPDPFNRAASHIDGAASILIGISANQSMATGMPVNCDDLLKLPEK